MKFRETYGPWAAVAGATQGIGRAFALSLAKRGMHLVLIARSKEPLLNLSAELKEAYPVDTLPILQDLSISDGIEQISTATADLDVGLLVYNAALAEPGPFLERQPEALRRLVATNCTAPLLLCRCFAEKLVKRGRGGFILMSSMSGFQGTPYVAAYGASKAFNLVLAEGLWYELKSANIDVLACCPGPTGTPGFHKSLRGKSPPSFPPVLSPQRVAEESLRGLGKRSVVVPAVANRTASILIHRLLPRQAGVRITANTTARMYRSNN